MKKILVCCNSSITTGLLVAKMRGAVEDMNLADVDIVSVPVSEATDHLAESDVVLLGPQVGYAKEGFVDAGARKVLVITSDDYAEQNAAGILDEALEAIGYFLQ